MNRILNSRLALLTLGEMTEMLRNIYDDDDLNIQCRRHFINEVVHKVTFSKSSTKKDLTDFFRDNFVVSLAKTVEILVTFKHKNPIIFEERGKGVVLSGRKSWRENFIKK